MFFHKSRFWRQARVAEQQTSVYLKVLFWVQGKTKRLKSAINIVRSVNKFERSLERKIASYEIFFGFLKFSRFSGKSIILSTAHNFVAAFSFLPQSGEPARLKWKNEEYIVVDLRFSLSRLNFKAEKTCCMFRLRLDLRAQLYREMLIKSSNSPSCV
jgi:hypothetical protein